MYKIWQLQALLFKRFLTATKTDINFLQQTRTQFGNIPVGNVVCVVCCITDRDGTIALKF